MKSLDPYLDGDTIRVGWSSITWWDRFKELDCIGFGAKTKVFQALVVWVGLNTISYND